MTSKQVPARPRMVRRHATLAVLGILAVGSVGCDRLGSLAAQLEARELGQPVTLPDVTLIDQRGEPFNLLEAAPGSTTLVFFGFTQCPDICPLTMATVARTMGMVEPAVRERTRVVFITLDPARDDPEQLESWLSALDPSFIGLTGEQGDLDATLAAFGYRMPPVQVSETEWYDVPHPATLFVLTEDGVGRFGYSNPRLTAEALAEDLTLLAAREW